MKVLFDQNVPRTLSAYLDHHNITLSLQMGWDKLRNGELLEVAEEAGFECIVTADRNLAYQQNLRTRRIAIVVLPSGNWPKLIARLSEILRAIDQATTNSYQELEPSHRSGAKGKSSSKSKQSDT